MPGSSSESRLQQVERARVVAGGLAAAETLGRVERDERARAGARLQHAADLQRADRLAHAGAADAEPPGELALGREPLPGGQPPGADVRGEPLGDPLVALRQNHRSHKTL